VLDYLHDLRLPFADQPDLVLTKYTEINHGTALQPRKALAVAGPDTMIALELDDKMKYEMSAVRVSYVKQRL
jgi:hypothetical protein